MTDLPSTVHAILDRAGPLLVDGEWVDAIDGGTLPVFDPSTAEELTTVAAAGPKDVDAAVVAARRAFDEGPWRRLSPGERTRLLWRLADLVEEHAEEFAVLESLDVGKPIVAARAGDVRGAVAVLRYTAGWADKLEGETLPLAAPPDGEYHAFTVREPVGVCAQIIPWNYPLVMAVWKIAPALAAGCTVVLKPAEETPLSALRLGELIKEAGFPPGVVNIIPGFGETAGAALAAHTGVDKIAFTGSTEVGRQIAHAAADNLSRVSLELGGKSPNVVFADADLERAIPGSARAIFTNAGQSCGSGSRVYIEEPVFDEVVSGIVAEAEALRLGPGLDERSQLGPIVSARQLERVSGYVDDAVADGATIVTGGARPELPGWFYRPTIVTDVRAEMQIVREEVFGPVLVAVPFSDYDDLVRRANDTRFGLAAGTWTRDLRKAFRVVRDMRAGRLYVNCWSVIDPALPVGGFKESGWGREMGRAVRELYTEVKAACVRID
ncbi:MAG: aldehyde dehydrogenase family protein [Propionibacteriales bacterium]|nr:aldehyde dehydrogenase family protein [Propionibacteriales bacterium]